jgi:nucleotide-binding universal stress UspA family protein
MKKILVSIDGSRSSINALKYAVKVARLLQAEIVGIHVINETSYSEYYQEISNKLKKEAEGVLKRVVDAVQKEGVVITTEVDTGIPDVILAQRAKTDPHVAMIVTSESRRGLGARVFIVSKAHALVDQIAAGLSCPVLVVPGNDDDLLKSI